MAIKSRTKAIITGVAIIVALSVGFGAYFGVAMSKKEIAVASFDGKVSLSFGKHRVGRVTEVEHYHYISFTPKDNSMIDAIENSDIFAAKREYDNGQTKYLLLYEGYYFIALKNTDGSITISNAYCEVVAAEGFAYTPFLCEGNQVYFTSDNASENENFMQWSYLDFADDFTSLVNFYNNINPEYLIDINAEAKTISLNYFLVLNGVKEIRTDKKLTLVCNDDGIDFMWEDNTDAGH